MQLYFASQNKVMQMETQCLEVSNWRLNPFPGEEKRTARETRQPEHRLWIKEDKTLNQEILKKHARWDFRLPLPVSVSTPPVPSALFLSVLGSAPSTEAQPCRCPSPARTTTWRGAMGTTASRAPRAPTWWTRPGPSSAPWPSSHAASAPSLHATSRSRSQRGNTLAWSTGVCVRVRSVCECSLLVRCSFFPLHMFVCASLLLMFLPISFLIHSVSAAAPSLLMLLNF